MQQRTMCDSSPSAQLSSGSRQVTKPNGTVLLQEYNESDRDGGITEKERKGVDGVLTNDTLSRRMTAILLV
jgi:hypothetical protein